tara:strand:- start:238 stop:408 length:171 start_codon:yes stop_codon:yes gene_type:complete
MDMYFCGSQKDGGPDKLIYNILVKKYDIQIENQYVKDNIFLGYLVREQRFSIAKLI